MLCHIRGLRHVRHMCAVPAILDRPVDASRSPLHCTAQPTAPPLPLFCVCAGALLPVLHQLFKVHETSRFGRTLQGKKNPPRALRCNVITPSEGQQPQPAQQLQAPQVCMPACVCAVWCRVPQHVLTCVALCLLSAAQRASAPHFCS